MAESNENKTGARSIGTADAGKTDGGGTGGGETEIVHTVTLKSVASDHPPVDAARVDDIELPKGQPIEGLSTEQVNRLRELPGLRFTVDPDPNKE